MIFLSRNLEIENPRVFSLQGGVIGFSGKKIERIGLREVYGEFDEYSIVMSCLFMFTISFYLFACY